MNPSKLPVTLLFVVSLCCLVTGRFTTEQIDQYGKACNASEEDLVVAKQYKVPTTESGKCLMKCMISKLGLLHDDGTYNKKGTEEALKKYWSEWPVEKTEQINNKCFEEAKIVSPEVISTCIYSYQVIACINAQAKILGML